MPNPGGPYGGCDACRRRKVKCDQTYPECRRCLKRKIICPGVKDKGTQIFRDETRTTAAKVESRELHWQHQSIGPKDETTPVEQPVNSSENNTSAVQTIDSFKESFAIPLHDHPEDVLAAFFFDQIICPDVGWYAYLPHIYRNTCRTSHLNHAIQAASLFVLANRQCGDPSLMSKARNTYGKALTALNAAIGDENERLKDEVLCTSLTFHVIEEINGSHHKFSHVHLSGLQRILRLRKNHGIVNLFGAEMWHSVAAKSQLLTLRSGSKTPFHNEILIPKMLVSPPLVTHKTFEAVRKFDSYIKEIMSDKYSYEDEALLYLLMEEGKELDLALQAWSDDKHDTQLTGRWRRHIGSSATLSPDTASEMEYFESIQAAKAWNYNRCARIHLHQALLDLAELVIGQQNSLVDEELRHDLEKTITTSSAVIDQMLDCICGSIPFNLHQIDSAGRICADKSQRVFGGAGLVWPLEVVMSCRRSSSAQRSLATDTLREIGHSIGVRQALHAIGENKRQKCSDD